jgi:metallo-beta-lactamase class B
MKPLLLNLHRTFLKALRLSASLFTLLAGSFAFGSAPPPNAPEWLEPYPPFKIAGPLYHVGSKDLAVYLITTPQGSILINSTLEENVPMIRANVEQLGFKLSDIKILLISHAHWDHCAASAEILRLTGAEYMVMDGDADVVESGGRSDFHYSDAPSTFYPPAKVDRVLRDSDTVELGGITLVAHRTAGHTRGCTTWALKISEAGRDYDAVIIGSPNVNEGFDLLNDPDYPHMANDYQRGFDVLKSLPCDLFLGAHGSYFNMLAKRGRENPGATNPFVDPEGYKKYVEGRERAFLNELAKQKVAAASVP